MQAPMQPARPERAEALSPGQRPGLLSQWAMRPVRAKALHIAKEFQVSLGEF